MRQFVLELVSALGLQTASTQLFRGLVAASTLKLPASQPPTRYGFAQGNC